MGNPQEKGTGPNKGAQLLSNNAEYYNAVFVGGSQVCSTMINEI